MKMGEVVRELRKKKKWSLNKLSVEADVDRGNLSRFENGKSGLREETLAKVLDALEVSLSEAYQMAEGGPDLVPASIDDVTEPTGTSGPTVISVPVMDASPSMGTGVSAPDNDAVVDFMRLSMMWVRRNLAISRPDALRIVIGLGDSMLPTFANGDLLLVDTGIHELKVDAIYCMAREDELFIKRVQRRMDGGFNIISDNDKYQPFVISSPEAEQLRILGRVVWAWNGRAL